MAIIIGELIVMSLFADKLIKTETKKKRPPVKRKELFVFLTSI